MSIYCWLVARAALTERSWFSVLLSHVVLYTVLASAPVHMTIDLVQSQETLQYPQEIYLQPRGSIDVGGTSQRSER